jgi:GxxExxY protein
MGLIDPGSGENEITEAVIGAAMAVHSDLRPGLDEKLYENAMCIEFAERGMAFSQQKEYPVHYHGHYIGKLIPDLIVMDKVIVDAKVVKSFTDEHVAQMVGYLRITGLQIGLLINFKKASLQFKRILASSHLPAPPPSDSPIHLQNPNPQSNKEES